MNNSCLYCGRGCMGDVCGDPQCIEQSIRDESTGYFCLGKVSERAEDNQDEGIDDIVERNNN